MPDWTLTDLENEFVNYGHHYIEPGRPRDMAIRAVEEVLAEADWIFQERTDEVIADEVVANLGRVKQVWLNDDQETILIPAPTDELRDREGLMSTPGTPQYYYRSGMETLGVYPASTEMFYVRHYSRAGWRSGTPDDPAWFAVPSEGTDTPGIPEEFRDLVLLLMLCYGKQDGEELPEAEQYRAEYERRLDLMRQQWGRTQVDEQRKVLVRGVEDWA